MQRTFQSRWIPTAIGLKVFLQNIKSLTYAKSLRVLLCLWIVLCWLPAIKFFIATVSNNLRYYPWRKVVDYVDKTWPQGFVYVNEDAATPWFHERLLLGPWTEQIFNSTKLLQPKIKDIKDQLAGKAFTIAIVPGSRCTEWQPRGWFADETKHLTHLDRKFGKICVFSRATYSSKRGH